MKLFKSTISKFLVFLMLFSCVDPIEIETITFENYLVIEATITDELKNHTIKLSRTFDINAKGPNPETGAQIAIIDSQNNTFYFNETSSGTYISENQFKAIPALTYTLKVTTKTGNTYSSTSEKLTNAVQIEKLTTSIETSREGATGVSISVHSFNPNNNANYYRYQYEETYKISPPFWSDENLIVVSDSQPFTVDVVKRSTDNKDCYKTINSAQILITETKSLAEDRVHFPVRFILESDFIISNRYSLLVKQYVQTFEAYNYYETLKKLSSSESVFTQAQPGFISGNIISDTDKNEKIIGFFEVSSVSEKRLFFNYQDIFPKQVSKFPAICDFLAPLLYDSFSDNSPLINLIKKDSYTYYGKNNTGLPNLEGPYLMVPKICGDCTVSGSNIKPSFWVD
ncbi:MULTISPECIES: DUF4249 domain-containing protein [unclassified Polaribacter]|uniref:DUF4249 domain-containing protein n=1 Tax=unclassified Polaribacter TaxID=196858 RepID=UPI0011BFAEB2|nr:MULTISPECIES: DUF4249 domain-containing protein [unclassified Polaribacter]TXD52956.1 DUF4249 domain-containing protein [Polaribacter sp. IC063]TXD60953.1 DUF4249 domain-containing protein [Polaribacter sp. IC066]